MVQTKLDQTQISDMATFCKNELGMLYLPKPAPIKNRNIVVDTSDFHKNFNEVVGNRTYKMVVNAYMGFTTSILNAFFTRNISQE